MKNIKCNHTKVTCINPYELIRKYKCKTCKEVMMCKCEEEFAVKFLPHQISEGSELKTQRRVKVTQGFQPNICNNCKGLPEKAYPMAEMHGNKSKIRRYYWREISFETIKRFEKFSLENKYTDWLRASIYHPEEYKKSRKEAIEELKIQHSISPKYKFNEVSQEAILTKYEIEIINMYGEHVKTEKKVLIKNNNKFFSAEEFAINNFNQLGYKTIHCESTPFHVLFGIFMYLLIQDPKDRKKRFMSFGNRDAFEKGLKVPIWTSLPEDFGTRGYSNRRRKAIKEHVNSLYNKKEDWLYFFSLLEHGSTSLRQYLWAHKEYDIERARNILTILSCETMKNILLYLVQDYWQRYLGWPDLLVYNDTDYFFVEVKSSKDKLSQDQKNWIIGNHKYLKLPFKIVKIHNHKENKP